MSRPRVIADALKLWRAANEYSPERAARILGVPVDAIKLWESGHPCRFAAQVETAMGVPVAKVSEGLLRA